MMIRKSIRLGVVAAGALCIAGAAGLAQAPDTPRSPRLPAWFREIDTADTGVITFEQYVAYRMKTFDQLDTNKDGTLDKEEFLKLAEPPYTPDSPRLPPLAQRRAVYEREFSQINTSGDGKVTREQVQARVALSFRELDIDGDRRLTRDEVIRVISGGRPPAQATPTPDRNNDGVIDTEEFVAYETARLMELDIDKDGKVSLPEWLVLGGQPGQNPPGQPPYEQRREALTKRFEEIDTNKDGFIDEAECRVMALALFQRIDIDKDGKISPTEWAIANSPTSPVR